MTETWTEDQVEALREWWPDLTITARAIGNRLGKTKSAVIGKAYRIGLKPRAEKPPPPEKKGAVHAEVKHRRCAWPMTEPSDPDFHFCGEPTAYEKPYCEHHCNIAYVRFSTPEEIQKAIEAEARV